MIIIPRDPSAGSDAQVTLRALCQHVVAMVGKYVILDEQGRLTGPPKPYSYTGCIFENRGNWFIATAGHVITALNKVAGNPRCRIQSAYLASQFGLGTRSDYPIPFNPLDQPKLPLDESKLGLDLGLIYLRPYYRMHLKADGIIPFTPKQWCFPDDLVFESFGVVGFPDEYTLPETGTGVPPGTASIRPVFVPLKKEADDTSKAMRRFQATIIDKGDQNSIVGMSGGPIVGFYREGGESKYLLHAIQSSWNEQDTVYGCYVQDSMRVVIAVAAAERELEEATGNNSTLDPKKDVS